MPELDVLRGVAILLVVSYHFFSQLNEHSLAPGWRLAYRASRVGWIGVPLFFVLSGFLITGILLDKKTAPDYFRSFYLRRLLRITPAMVASLFLYWCTNMMKLPDVLISVFGIGNFAPAFNMQITPYWSLGIEEQFYLLWPLVVLRLKEAPLKVTAATLIAFAVLGRIATWFAYGGFHQGIQFYTWCVVDGLALGALLALVVRQHNENLPAIRLFARNLFLSAVAVTAILFPFGVIGQTTFAGSVFRVTIICALFTAALAWALTYCSEGRKLPAARLLTFFGYISYGLYLIHWPVFVLADRFIQAVAPELDPRHGTYAAIAFRVLFAGGAAVLIAYLSRRYYEDPFLRLKSRPAVSPRKADPIASNA